MQNTSNYKAHPMDADCNCHGKGEKQQDLDGYDYSGCSKTSCTYLGFHFWLCDIS